MRTEKLIWLCILGMAYLFLPICWADENNKEIIDNKGIKIDSIINKNNEEVGSITALNLEKGRVNIGTFSGAGGWKFKEGLLSEFFAKTIDNHIVRGNAKIVEGKWIPQGEWTVDNKPANMHEGKIIVKQLGWLQFFDERNQFVAPANRFRSK
jgi:hypothetical protein